jgi:hypothetical protein
VPGACGIIETKPAQRAHASRNAVDRAADAECRQHPDAPPIEPAHQIIPELRHQLATRDSYYRSRVQFG